MEQFEIVLETPEGMSCTVIQQENKKLIIRLEPNLPVPCEGQDKATYFTKVTADDREKVKKWLKGRESINGREVDFLKRANEAVQRVTYDYWIATIEPSVAEGKIFYMKNTEVGKDFSSIQWMEMAENYAPERGSRMASIDELFIWYALRIVNKFWTLDYVANNSSSAGNFKGAPNATHAIEKSAARKCGGYCDGQGNTCRIVTIKDGFAIVGGYFRLDGHKFPVADVYYIEYPDGILKHSTGVLVLTN